MPLRTLFPSVVFPIRFRFCAGVFFELSVSELASRMILSPNELPSCSCADMREFQGTYVTEHFPNFSPWFCKSFLANCHFRIIAQHFHDNMREFPGMYISEHHPNSSSLLCRSFLGIIISELSPNALSCLQEIRKNCFGLIYILTLFIESYFVGYL